MNNSFADRVLTDWDDAMDRFFRAVDRKAGADGLSPDDVYDALDRGYGLEVAEEWNVWVAS